MLWSEEASLRAGDDRTVPAAATKRGAYRPGFFAAIDACLTMRHAERPQCVAQLRPLMLGPGSQLRVAGLPATGVLHDALSKVSVAAERNPMRWAIAIGTSFALFGGAYLGIFPLASGRAQPNRGRGQKSVDRGDRRKGTGRESEG